MINFPRRTNCQTSTTIGKCFDATKSQCLKPQPTTIGKSLARIFTYEPQLDLKVQFLNRSGIALGAKRTDNIFLPFDGDNTLSVILSKTFLLIGDGKIKDATIANQIRLD